MTFEQLSVGKLIRSQPRLPGCLRTDTVREIGSGLGARISATIPLETVPYFSFGLTGKCGAALVTKHPTYSEDTMLENSFERYTKRHYESWVVFACSSGYGDDVQPVLVSGFDMTREFAMIAYSFERASPEFYSTTTFPVSLPGSVQWGECCAPNPPHINCGPLHPAQAIDTLPSQLAEEETIPSSFNQCIFIRYYSMVRGPLGLFPKVIRV